MQLAILAEEEILQRKAVFLDRDGTIIEDKLYLNDPQQIVYLPKAFEALRLLKSLGFDFFVATNQSGIARGIVDPKNLHEIHRIIRHDFAKAGVEILEFYYAPYATDSDHPLRKPNPGMLLEAARDYNVNMAESWMIGDRMTDVIAGQKAGAKSILIGTTEVQNEKPVDFHYATDLWEAAQFISNRPISK